MHSVSGRIEAFASAVGVDPSMVGVNQAGEVDLKPIPPLDQRRQVALERFRKEYGLEPDDSFIPTWDGENSDVLVGVQAGWRVSLALAKRGNRPNFGEQRGG